MSLSMLINAFEMDEVLPKVLMERLISLKSLYFCLRFPVKSWYLLVFRASLIDSFVSKQIVNSRIYKNTSQIGTLWCSWMRP